MNKFICIANDETSTWYIHMQYFMIEKFGINKIVYGEKNCKGVLNNIKNYFLITKNIIHQLEDIPENSQLFLFHPMPPFFNLKKIKKKLMEKHVIMIGFVCDIAMLHLNDKENKNTVKKMYAYLKDRILKKYDLIIVPTIKMKDYLTSIGVFSNRIIIHGLYDYHVNATENERECKDGLIIAGDLSHERNNYVYQLHSLNDLQFNLYGYGFDAKYKKENISYFGMINEVELNEKMCGKFGLCWYGSELESLTGFSAEYIKINSPHKVSLYIANGIPVIVSDEAGIADYIKENHLGILVHNLKDLPDILCEINDEEYTNILSHVKDEGKKLREGNHLKKSLIKIDKICSSQGYRR